MAGLRMLAGEGGAASVDASGPLAGVGVISGYELCLLGAALLVLWPRRISYETTAILIIFSVVRFATPFLTIGLATDGHLGTAIGVGLCLTLLMAAKGEAISRRVGLKLHGWERLFDYGLFMLAAVAFPLLAERLSAWTGDAITLRSARLVQLASWWALTLVLLPLTRGISPESAQDAGPLQSRLPARVWRCVTSIGMVALLFGALWLAGDSPSLLAVLPLVLFAAALVGTLLVSGGGVTPAFFAHVPAAVVAVAAIVSSSLLMGRVRVLAHPVAVLALGGMAAFWLPLIVRDRAARVRGLRSLGYVAALVPLRFCHSLTSASVYAFALAVVVLLG
jgi:hypothetical protein